MRDHSVNPTAFFKKLTLIAAGVSAALSSPVYAQNAAKGGLEEVIVTATRREQNLQDVAISMTVLSQEQISNANMTNSADLAAFTPGLTTNNRFGSENASFAIRGFTMELRTTASVGVYFAEVAAPRGQNVQTSGDGAGPGTLFDLENIQVLKGPQGTLFGRNTTGGAVLMVPTKPTDTFEGSAELTTGDRGLRELKAIVNVPFGDDFKIRLSVSDKEADGHVRNVSGIGSDELSNVDYTAFRLSSLIDISDSMTNYTVLNYADSDTFGGTASLFDCSSATPAENPLVAFTGTGCNQQLADQAAAGQDGFYDAVSTVANPITAIEDIRFINKFSWAFAENYTFNSILSMSNLVTDNTSDIFGTKFTETQASLLGLPVSVAVADPRREFVPGVSIAPRDAHVTDQAGRVAELQIQGLSFDGALDWQSGLYWEDSQPNGFSGNDSAILVSCDVSTIETGDPDQYNCFDVTNGALGGVSQIRNKTVYRNKAIFAQGTYDVFDWMSITAGARYTWDDTKGFINFTRYTFVADQIQTPTVRVEQASQSSEAPTGLMEVQFRPYEDVMVYGKYVRGYRQGSVNMAADVGIQTHDKETVDTFEIGAKTSFDWIIPGRVNFALFDNDFTDMQLQGGYVSSDKGPTTAIFNAGSASIRGAEIEGFFQLAEGLILNLSYSRLLTELLEQEDNQPKVAAASGPVGGATFSPSAVVGDELPFASDVSYTVGLSYTRPMGPDLGLLNIGLNYSYIGEQRMSGTGTTPYDMLGSFDLLNGNVSWFDIMGTPLDLTVFGTNLQDDDYTTYISGTDSSLGFSSRQVGSPRTIGARLKYNF
ncbi:TonB-dependent receptor [Zhongshania sp.]|uniref:TonB-dependent receptor n=1 Tax=Zhongshania sp. TaxID=1971902 RepID=UPI00356B2712